MFLNFLRSRWGIAIALIGLGVLVLVGAKAYEYFFEVRPALLGYEQYMQKFKGDEFGGKTPEETLKLFIAALRASDVVLASKYFAPDDTGSREKWVAALKKDKEEGNLQEIINAFTRAQSSSHSEKNAFYRVLNKDGSVGLLIELVHNGGVWKIENF